LQSAEFQNRSADRGFLARIHIHEDLFHVPLPPVRIEIKKELMQVLQNKNELCTTVLQK
jgi:hypothetical protein